VLDSKDSRQPDAPDFPKNDSQTANHRHFQRTPPARVRKRTSVSSRAARWTTFF
jgi:hypothetical protein